MNQNKKIKRFFLETLAIHIDSNCDVLDKKMKMHLPSLSLPQPIYTLKIFCCGAYSRHIEPIVDKP